MAKINLKNIKQNSAIGAFLKQADKNFMSLGYKEHGSRHAQISANVALSIMKELGYLSRECELSAIGAYLHDIGNAISQKSHAQSGAILSMRLLSRMGMKEDEIFKIIRAVGGHEEKKQDLTSPITAAVILGDKSDVCFARVRNSKGKIFDAHDRVNYACQKTFVRANKKKKEISLELEINTEICSVMEYFEIFLSRILFCQKSVKCLNCNFVLFINKTKFL